jgi:hypothetical protein
MGLLEAASQLKLKALGSTQSMFATSRLLLEQYYCALLRLGLSARGEHLLSEARGRLRRLQWLYDRLEHLDHELDRQARAELTPDKPMPDVIKQVFADTGRPDCTAHAQASLPFSPSDEMAVLLEAFYYSAHRVRDILQDGRAELKGLGYFEAEGIRDVRNHLVEHPSRKNGVLVPSIATGGRVGPQLKPLRWSLDPQGTNDAGLYANAREFERRLDMLLSQAIAACAA